MNKLLISITLILLYSCSSQKSGIASKAGYGDTRTKKVELIDDNTYLITEYSDDKSYGYDQSNPVKVGGAKESIGPQNERRFLNGLLGPNGEKLKFFRAGSCCAFKTPHGMINDTGLLDRYRVFWAGAKDTLDIYINMYDLGDLKVPVGLTAKKK